MKFQYMVVAMALLVAVSFTCFFFIFLSRFTKVGPNEVLIVSGRRRQLPDGTFAGFRFVKGGGTFVWPVLEKAARLSLEVFSVEITKFKTRTTDGALLEADCVAQVKIKGDDASILAAAEHFLAKSEADMRSLVRPTLEKHLQAILGSSNAEAMVQDPGAGAAQVQAAASAELERMGLNVIGLTIQNVLAK